MNRTELDVRAAFGDLADLAPLTLPDRTTPSRVVAPARRSPRRRWAPVLAAAAVVTAVAGGSLVAHWMNHDSAAPPAVSAPSYPTSFAFSADSMSSKQWSLADSTLSPVRRTNTFVGPCGPSTAPAGPSCTLYLSQFVPDSTAQREIGGLPQLTIGGSPYRVGSFDPADRAGTDELAQLTRPAALSDRVRPTLLWAAGDGSWLAMSGDVQTYSTTGAVATDAAAPAGQLATLRRLITARPSSLVSPVRFSGLPGNLRFASAAMTDTGKFPVGGRTNLLGNPINGPYSIISFVDRSVPAEATLTRNPSVDVTLLFNLRLPSLDQVTAAQVAERAGPGPWTRTTVGGHTAWVGPHGLLVQIGGAQLSVATAGAAAGPPTTISELTQVAAAITAVSIEGYPLLDAVPAAALQ